MQAPGSAPPSQFSNMSQQMGQPQGNMAPGGQQGQMPPSHQQNMNELQRQAVEDEAALLQAISSTTNPVFVRPGGPDNQLNQNPMLSEQQLRAAQSISGNYQASAAYSQPGQYTSSQPQPGRQPQPPANQQMPTPAAPVPPQPVAQPAPQVAAPQPAPQLNRAPSSVSPSGGGMDKKNKVNPTKTLLESNLFFVDDELTGSSDSDDLPDFSSLNTSSVSGGYAPSDMSNRDAGIVSIPTAEMAASQLDSIQKQSESGTSFSQAPSFGPGAAKNAGSAILESMKKRNLGAQSNENNPVIPPLPPSAPLPIPSQINQHSSNPLSQFEQSGGVGTGSSSNIPRLPQPGLGQSSSASYDQQSGGYKAAPPFTETQSMAMGSPSASYGQPNLGYDERMPSPEIVGESAMNNSSTFPARSMSQPLDDIPEPHVGIATSSRIAKSHGASEAPGRGRDMEPPSNAARSRIRSGVSSERPSFFQQNKMAVIIVGVILLILIVAGAVVGVLFSLHMIKT
jgi:hypothetical protein